MVETNLRRRKGAKSSSTFMTWLTVILSPKKCVFLLVFIVVVSWTFLSASFLKSSVFRFSETDNAQRQRETLFSRPELQFTRRITPYENKTQQLLPEWARKPHFMPMDETNPQVCLVHIGKTAGSTLACLLGFEYSCGNQTIVNGELPQKTTHLNHNFINDCPETTEYYLITTRDPLERIKSWFAYERPSSLKDIHWAVKRPLFIDCPYRTLNELAEKGLSPHGNVSHECRYRAWEAIRGKKPYCRHNYYNYQYYMKTIPVNAKILAIRSEHIAKDWNAAERIVSRAETPVTIHEGAFKPRNKTRQKRKADTELSSEARKLVCRALCKEIRTYKEILTRAENLDSMDFEKSMELLDETCPEQSRADRCL